MTDLVATYPRAPDSCRDEKATGHYGRLHVCRAPDEPIDFMWRGDGYVRLPPGVYEAKFSKLRSGQRCIRVIAPLASFPLTKDQQRVLDDDTLCIHAAQHPSQLKGCQAPGRHRAPDGWVAGDSTSTFGLVCHLLGGFVLDKTLVLEVRDG